MRDSVRSAFVRFTTAYEGCVPWMYQDVKGLVTVAIGNLIDPIQYAAPLPFVDRVTGALAQRDDIMREWMRVKNDASLARLGHRAAERVTNLRLNAAGIEFVVSRKLDQNDQHLRGRFPYFEEWPACSQLGAHSMAWAAGPSFRFPRLEIALRAEDWATAATECHLNEAGNPGLKPRNVANKVLFLNAARVRDFKLDPDLLAWEADLDVSGAPTVPALPEGTAIVHADPSLYNLGTEPPDSEPA